MPSPTVPLRRLLPAVAVVTTPALGVMVVLAALEHIAILPALAAVAAIALLNGMLLRPYFLDLARIVAYGRDLTRNDNARPPVLCRAGPIEDMATTIAQLRRSWAQKTADLHTMLLSNESVLDSLPDPLFMLNDQRRVVRANLAARKLFGREVTGRDLAAVLRDPAVLDASDKVIGGQPGRDVEFTLPVPVERDLRARLESLPMRAADGTVAVLALHDMTAIKRMEQMRADFVANASHELRTPLATLLGFIETLRGSARDDEEARERFLAIMHEQGSRMARLVDDLLSLSRIELNEHTQPLGHADLRRILRSVTDTLELHAKTKGMTLDLTLPERLPPVMGQSDELQQVFTNLVDNAIKYGRDKTPIDISIELTDKLPPSQGIRLRDFDGMAIAVSVRDHGDGIAKEHLPRLTERFFRVDTARSRKLGGTGLGLAIVKHVVNRHRGVLTVDSTLGEGTVFTVYLPVSEAADASAGPLGTGQTISTKTAANS